MGILHGGASSVLAESAASMGAFMNCNPEEEYAVGIELNVSHLKSKKEGLLRATATPVRKGRSVHVWEIMLTDENDSKVATSRCTVLIRSWNDQKT
jgi:1,4-dihydroxy-2-naphthoyl-CoA hydrolase